MEKEEFIKILKTKQKESGRTCSCFQDYSNDRWEWFEPTIDGLQPSIDLSCDGKVVFQYAGSLYDNEPRKKEEFSYEDFLKFFSRKMGPV